MQQQYILFALVIYLCYGYGFHAIPRKSFITAENALLSLFASQTSLPGQEAASASASNPQPTVAGFKAIGVTSDDSTVCPVPGRVLQHTANSVAFKGPSSHQVHFKWRDRPKRVLFLLKRDTELLSIALEALHQLKRRDLTVLLEPPLFEQLRSQESTSYSSRSHEEILDILQSVEQLNQANIGQIDFIVTFGGDGLLMHCNTLFGGRPVPPTMCFDFGSLGFLAPFTYEDFEKELDRVIEGAPSLTLRMRLECTIYRDISGSCSSTDTASDGSNDSDGSPNSPASMTPTFTFHVLNEAVIDRGPSPFLSAIDLECDGAYLTTVQGDGLIVASPTGSTAYSLAAGGSMVHPSVPAILITPICAHTLSFRPVLLPDSAVLTCAVPPDARSSAWVSFDGKSRQELTRGDRLSIKMSPYPMPTVNRLSFTEDWFNSLRSQFMFNSRPRQKKLQQQPSE